MTKHFTLAALMAAVIAAPAHATDAPLPANGTWQIGRAHV